MSRRGKRELEREEMSVEDRWTLGRDAYILETKTRVSQIYRTKKIVLSAFYPSIIKRGNVQLCLKHSSTCPLREKLNLKPCTVVFSS
jgi:hypothetical protein